MLRSLTHGSKFETLCDLVSLAFFFVFFFSFPVMKAVYQMLLMRLSCTPVAAAVASASFLSLSLSLLIYDVLVQLFIIMI